MENRLKNIFNSGDKIAIQYSPKNAIPYISRVDAGTYELLKSFKIKLHSSADLVQEFEASLTQSQLNTHINAAKHLNKIVQKTFKTIKQKIEEHEEVNEYIIQKFMLDEMDKGIDAVTVAVPDHTHAAASAAAIEAGKHVFCEKPLTRTVHESRALRELARELKSELDIDLVFQWIP